MLLRKYSEENPLLFPPDSLPTEFPTRKQIENRKYHQRRRQDEKFTNISTNIDMLIWIRAHLVIVVPSYIIKQYFFISNAACCAANE